MNTERTIALMLGLLQPLAKVISLILELKQQNPEAWAKVSSQWNNQFKAWMDKMAEQGSIPAGPMPDLDLSEEATGQG